MPAESFNLTPEEILAASDADLNEFISLKKLAPYRSAAKVESDETKWKKIKKKKLWEFRLKLQGKRVFEGKEDLSDAKISDNIDGDRLEAYFPKKKKLKK